MQNTHTQVLNGGQQALKAKLTSGTSRWQHVTVPDAFIITFDHSLLDYYIYLSNASVVLAASTLAFSRVCAHRGRSCVKVYVCLCATGGKQR